MRDATHAARGLLEYARFRLLVDSSETKNLDNELP